MSSLNQCQFIGNLGRDPDIRYSGDGKAIASLAIACSEKWKDKNTGEQVENTEWVNVSAFGRLAEVMGEYLKKGSKVYVSGKMKTDKVEKDGQTKYYTKIIAREMIMLDSKAQSGGVAQQQAVDTEHGDTSKVNDFDDSIPF